MSARSSTVGAVAVAQYPGDPGGRDALGHLVAEVFQPARRDPRGAVLVEGQFRMFMQILVNAAKAACQPVCHE
jgi:hypothetical protein